MARKTAKKKDGPPQFPGRLLQGWKGYSQIEMDLDDAAVRDRGEKLQKLFADRELENAKLSEIKAKLAEFKRREVELVHAMASRHEEKGVHGWQFCDDEKGLVTVVDDDGTILGTRPMEDWDRQTDMELDDSE